MIHLLNGDNHATGAGCADYALWVGVHDVLNTPACAKCADYGQLADMLILSLGVLLLLDRNPFKTLPQIHIPILRHPFLNAYVYGLLYGPITLPCSGPLVVSVFALSLTVGEAFSKLWVFLWFGAGFGMPLLVLSLLSGALQRQLTLLFARHSRLINVIGGLLLIGIVVYDIVQNWEILRLFYS
jgi:cytochrome c-type biogenesis protein